MNYYSLRISVQESLAHMHDQLKSQFANTELLDFKGNQLFHHIEDEAPQLVICKPAAGKKLLDYALRSSNEIDQALIEYSSNPGLVIVGPHQDFSHYDDLTYPYLFTSEENVISVVQKILDNQNEDDSELELFFEELKVS